MSKFIISVHLFYTGRRISLKTQQLTPTPLWCVWSVKCHTGPAVVLQLDDKKGASNNQVNLQEGVLSEGVLLVVILSPSLALKVASWLYY